jgi:hypothetical protein
VTDDFTGGRSERPREMIAQKEHKCMQQHVDQKMDVIYGDDDD